MSRKKGERRGDDKRIVYDDARHSVAVFCQRSVSDRIVAFIPAPTPCSHSSISHAHSIHTPTLPTLLTFTQVLWFLPRLTRHPASCCVNTTRLTVCFTPQPSVCEASGSLRFSVLVSRCTDTHLYVFSLALALPLINNKKERGAKLPISNSNTIKHVQRVCVPPIRSHYGYS